LKNYIAENKGVKGFPNAEYHEREDVIYKPCDIFIPAALEMAINGNNAHLFECKVIVEAANGPTTI
jgi:glutamate dehydrogenase (NAD(P)+)